MTDAVTNTAAATQTSQAGAGQSVAQQAKAEGDAAISDFNDFLTLLTAQLRYQDPLNPLDSTQFVEQLASFSAVEQAVGTNTRLDEIMAQSTGQQLADAAAWVGREIKAAGVDFAFDGTSLAITVPKEEGMERASVVIRDQEGREVATLKADPNGGVVTWDGARTGGGQATAGDYKVEFVYGRGTPGSADEQAVTKKAEGAGEVKEVVIENGSPKLVLENGVRVDPDAVTAVVDPTDAGE